VEARTPLQSAEKQEIARAAASLVKPGQVIFLDAGTIVVEMVPWLKEISPLTIITNALNAALAEARAPFDNSHSGLACVLTRFY